MTRGVAAGRHSERQHAVYPPQFNLRHFMSHLAPGGYCFLYVTLFSFTVAWLFFPPAFEELPSALKGANPAVTAVVFTVFIVVCYFVGVVLRLPSVDHIDRVSIEHQLRRKLKSGVTDQRGIVGKITDWFRPNGSQPMKYSDVTSLLTPAPSSPPADTSIDFRSWFRKMAAANLRPAASTIPPLRVDATILKAQPDTTLVMQWLWAVDEFPYPLWLTYKVLRETTDARRAEFNRLIWPLLIETMRGEASAKLTSKGAFNRVKLDVRRESQSSPRMSSTERH